LPTNFGKNETVFRRPGLLNLAVMALANSTQQQAYIGQML
jgi:hypothetical protein